MTSLSYSLHGGIGLGNLHLTSKGVQEERLVCDDAHPKASKILLIKDLPDDCLSLVYKSLESSNRHSSFGLVCRHWLRIQNSNHESLWESNYKCCLRESPQISPENFSKILCRLLIRFQNLKRLSLSGLPRVTNYITSQSQLFESKVQFLCLNGRLSEYLGKKELSLIFSLFPSLISVRLCDSRITNKGLKVLAKHCVSLQTIDLGNCQKISDKGLKVLAKSCASLQKVYLGYCKKITDKGLETLARNCAFLKEVDLSRCKQITDKSLEILAESCASLEKIYLGNCHLITDKGLAILAKSCPSLEIVDITDCNQISDKGLQVLARNCASLVKVDLENCEQITDRGLEVLAKCCASLDKVNLGNCQMITDKGLEILAKSCASLQNVDLTQCPRITDSGISFLIHNCRKLRSVIVTDCINITGIGFLGCPKSLIHVTAGCKYDGLTTEGIKAIASGGGIQNLCLSGNAVDNEAIITISKCCPLIKLLTLYSCHELQLEGWKTIGMYFTNLEELYVDDCPNLCDQGLKALCDGCNKLSCLCVDTWSNFSRELFMRERPDVYLI